MGSIWVVCAALALAPAGDLAHGIDLFQNGKFAEAEAELRDVAGAQARAYRAASLDRLERYAEAETEAKAALADEAVAVAALGEALVKQDKLDEAIDRMTTALAADANLAYAYYWRGQSRQRKQQIARMAEDYQSFVRLAPEAPEATAVRAVLAGLR
jgi:tetratricopeptide (TPR) repeat protein